MKIIQQTDAIGNTYEVVVLENEDGSTSSMSKAHYDELKANETSAI
jgi:hypothetical protein